MIAYLEKYNKLPQELRDKMSERAVVEAVDNLEKKYSISLAKIIIEVMIKEIKADELEKKLKAIVLDNRQVEVLAGELKAQVFGGVANYLGIVSDKTEKRASNREPEIAEQQINSLEKIDSQTAQKLSHGANFFFSPDDEREIREISKKINTENLPMPDNELLEVKTEKVVKAAKINFGSESLLKRFRQIIKTYLKGIRDKIGTKETLLKSFDAGGLGFDDKSADELLKLADEANKNILTIPAKSAQIKKPQKSAIRDYDYNFAKELKNRDVKSILEKIDISHEIAPPHPVLAEKKTPEASVANPLKAVEATAKKPEDSEKKEQKKDKPLSILDRIRGKSAAQKSAKDEKPEPFLKETASAANAGSAIVAVPAQNTVSGKIKIEDIKIVPKAFGPVEELKYMDLINFRRLGNLPDVNKKIIEKINLLEEDSYAKKIEGVKAWRSNPVNKIYLEMGQASIGEHKPISDIIKERSASGQEFLTEEEFTAVMDLNKQLRF